MSTLDKTSTPSASSDGAHDPALERSGPAGAPAQTPGAGNASGTPSTDDGGLHLQNAHFGALKVSETNEPATDGGKASDVTPEAEKIATPDTDNNPQTARQLEDPAPKAGGETNTNSGTPAPSAPSGNSTVVQGETFAAANTQNAPADGGTAELKVLPQSATFEEAENQAPSDIDLSNTTIAENAAGAVVGSLTTVDPDVAETFRYTLSDDRFEVVDGLLKLKDGIALDHEGEPSVTSTRRRPTSRSRTPPSRRTRPAPSSAR
jgi:hypothetical protein